MKVNNIDTEKLKMIGASMAVREESIGYREACGITADGVYDIDGARHKLQTFYFCVATLRGRTISRRTIEGLLKGEVMCIHVEDNEIYATFDITATGDDQ